MKTIDVFFIIFMQADYFTTKGTIIFLRKENCMYMVSFVCISAYQVFRVASFLKIPLCVCVCVCVGSVGGCVFVCFLQHILRMCNLVSFRVLFQNVLLFSLFLECN